MAAIDFPDAQSAPPASLRRRVAEAMQLARGNIAAWSQAEAGRAALWAPVGIGAGAALYFGLKSEPAPLAGPFLLVAAGLFWRFRSSQRLWAAAAFFMALGFTAAEWRAARVDAPAIVREMTPTRIEGRLVSVEESPRFRRLIIAISAIEGVEAAASPRRVRLTWRGKEFHAAPGDLIALRAGLSPPPPPAAPGAFDFARQLYFQEIGGVGYAVTPPQVIAAPRFSLAAEIERARLSLARRITTAAPGQGGALVAAVVTGKRAAVNEASVAALRDAGLAHLLAISGLHMGLATGLIFFAVRFALAAVEPIALRYPIKKWAAGAALASGFAYLLLSGSGWSARRAFIMTSIVFVAIIADRRGLSLRNVAIAATIILLTTPEAVVHPGFQMSFAAVTALIAAYEWAAARGSPDRSFSWPARLRRYAVGVGVTDTIAAAATAPYSLYHFNRAALYGLPANILSVPIMGLWVMPAAIFAVALIPLGLDGPLWRLSASGVEAILAAGGAVAGQPGAVAVVAQWPPAALAVTTLGGLWLCLQRGAWRLGGLAAIPVAAVMCALTPPPAIFVAADGENAGLVIARPETGGALALFNPRRDSFSARVWKEYAGLDAARAPTIAIADAGRCDPAGCVASEKRAVVAVSNDPLGLAEDCARADLVIAAYPVSGGDFRACKGVFIDRRSVWARGAHAIWIGKRGEIRIRTAADARGVRPWTGEETGESAGRGPP